MFSPKIPDSYNNRHLEYENYVSFEKRTITTANSTCQCIDCDNDTYLVLIVIGREEICCVYGRHNNELHF